MTAPGTPGRTLRKVGLWLLILGALLGIGLTLGGLGWSFYSVDGAHVDAANKATYLARGISIAMYGPIAGASVMAAGALCIVLALAKSRPVARH